MTTDDAPRWLKYSLVQITVEVRACNESRVGRRTPASGYVIEWAQEGSSWTKELTALANISGLDGKECFLGLAKETQPC